MSGSTACASVRWQITAPGESLPLCASGSGRPGAPAVALAADAARRSRPALRGLRVRNYFDNLLLPDSEQIHAPGHRFPPGRGVFELLRAIGRRCVGAVQLLPEGGGQKVSSGSTRSPRRADVEHRLLRAAVAPVRAALAVATDLDDFRHLDRRRAGARGRPATQGAGAAASSGRPPDHPRLRSCPLGLVGNRRADVRTSVENGWLCARLLAGVPDCQWRNARNRDASRRCQKVLVVEQPNPIAACPLRAITGCACRGRTSARPPATHAGAEEYRADGGPAGMPLDYSPASCGARCAVTTICAHRC